MSDQTPATVAPASRHLDGLHAEAERSLIGRGISFFPLQRIAGGALAMTRGDEVIAESIRMIIMTAPGERVMRPDFGCAIWDHVFAPINAATLGQMAHAVREALSRWETRIEVDEVRVTPESDSKSDSTVNIEVAYTISASNDRRNLVFPFYVLPEEEWS